MPSSSWTCFSWWPSTYRLKILHKFCIFRLEAFWRGVGLNQDTHPQRKSLKLLASSGLVSFWTFISRILGLVRDVVITGLLGAGVALDTFVVIMKIPSVFRRLFAEGAFNQAFVPVIAEYKDKEDSEIRNLIDNTFSSLSAVLIIVTALALLFTPIFVMIFAPGFYMEPLKKDLAIDILQITFPYLFFVSLVAFSGSILNSYQKFSLPALTPLFYNLSLLIWTLFNDYHFNSIGYIFIITCSIIANKYFIKKI